MLSAVNSSCYVTLYIIIYNLSLYTLVTILSYFHIEIKTLNLLNKMNNIFIFKTWSLIILFSVSGIPPFFGFFIKLTLLYYITSNSFLISFVFTVFLLINLYFYLQNIRYFMWTDSDFLKLNNWNLKFIKLNSVEFSITLISILIYGMFMYDDLILISCFLIM